MTDTDGTSQDTGSTATTVQDAAARIEAMLSGTGQSEGDETQEAEASTEADEEEAPEAEAETDEEESTEDDETDDSEEPPPALTVTIDGEEVPVTLDELKKGYSRHADYTRKTMDLAEQRKTLDAEKTTVAQERTQYADALKKVAEFFSGSIEDDSAELAELRQTDPGEYAARIADKQVRQQNLQAIQAEQTRIADEAKREEATQRAEFAKGEMQKLLAALPDWKDEAKAKAERGQIVDYALSLGLDQDEVDGIIDHRVVLALRDAAKWRALQAKKPAVQAKVEAVKAAKPGSAAQLPSKVSEVTRSKQRLAKTGRVEDAASAIERMLG